MTVFEFELGNKGLTKTALTEKNDFFFDLLFCFELKKGWIQICKISILS